MATALPQSPEEACPGDIVGQYVIRRKLGSGGSGAVYLAHDIRLDRRVALKLLSPHFQADHTAWVRLLKEARAASALNHPAICMVYDIGEDRGRAYVAMEYVKGRLLASLLACGALPVRAALDCGIQIIAGVAHAHRHGVVHGDLSASNVLVTPQEQVKIIDFGLARGFQRYRLELPGALHPVQGDLRAFGVLLFHMLAGALPRNRPLPPSAADVGPLALPPEVSAGLRAIVRRCLEVNRVKHYGSALEVLSHLRAERA